MGKLSSFSIRRVNGPTLVFSGEKLAHAKPAHAGSDEQVGVGWTEFELYRTSDGALIFVVLKKGRPYDKNWAFIADSWEEIKEALDVGEKDKVRISWTSLTVQLIEEAIEVCPEAKPVFTLYLGGEQHSAEERKRNEDRHGGQRDHGDRSQGMPHRGTRSPDPRP